MSRVLVTFSAAVHPEPRPALVPNGYGGIRYKDSKEYREYKAILTQACEEALPGFWSVYDKPTEIWIICQYKQLKSRPKDEWKDTVPDNDNLHKPVQDALTGLVFTDDKTVVMSHVAKVFGDEDRVTVQVRTVDGREESLDGWIIEE